MATALSFNVSILHKSPTSAADAGANPIPGRHVTHLVVHRGRWRRPWAPSLVTWRWAAPPSVVPRADDSSSAPFQMSVEDALKLLGVSEGASFDDILQAKHATVASCKDDAETIAQVEAAYDILLMQSLSKRRAGKVVSSGIRYAGVKPVRGAGEGAMLRGVQTSVKNVPVSIGAPSTRDLGIQAGVYGALMAFTYTSGTSTASGETYAGADVPGVILATGIGASLYFLTKKSVSLGKATMITVGGLVVGAVVGSAIEKWLQVEIVPFIGIHSPAEIISEFILFSQLLISLYLR